VRSGLTRFALLVAVVIPAASPECLGGVAPVFAGPPLGQHALFSCNDASRTSAPDRQLAFGYDSRGRAASADVTGGEQSQLGYDGSLATGGPVSGQVARTYDDHARISQTTVDGGSSVSYRYDHDGLLTSAGDLTLTRDPANGLLTGLGAGALQTTITSDAFGAPASIDTSAAGVGLWHEGLVSDGLGRTVTKSEVTPSGPSTWGYTYTPDGRLEDVRRDGVLVAHYEYDANGNRMSVTRGAFSTSYSYDDQDRLLSAGDVSYAYDQAGDLQTRTQGGQVTAYRYDALGNLTGVDLPNGRHVTYTLDALGRRIERKVDGTLTQAFLYAPETQGPVAQLNAAGGLVSRFVYATSTSVPDYFTRGGHRYQIVRDDLGSPRLVVDTASGQVAEQLDYDEYGRTLTDTNPGLQPFGYAGGLKDIDTGLVHFGARDYDPETGRWTTKDPIGLQGGDTDLYAYAGGDPINNTDPSGLAFIVSVLPAATGRDTVDELAGFFDTATLGVTCRARQALGDDNVDFSSPYYFKGGAGAIIATAGAGAAADAEGLAIATRSAAQDAEGAEEAATAPTKITGYAIGRDGSRHGLQQAISRDGGRGVSPQAMLDAVRSGQPQYQAARGTWKYVGDDAVVVLNSRGQVVTAWSRGSKGWRNQP